MRIPIVDSAKVMAKGQITLPKDIRSKLGLTTGDRVTLICEEDRVVLMNSAVYAMKVLQKEMEGEAEKAALLKHILSQCQLIAKQSFLFSEKFKSGDRKPIVL